MSKETIIGSIRDILSGKSFIVEYERNNPLGFKRRAEIIPSFCIFDEKHPKNYHYYFEIESLEEGIEVIRHFYFGIIDESKFKVDNNKQLYLHFAKIQKE